MIGPGAAITYYLCKRSSSSTVHIYADDITLRASAAVSDLPAVQQRLREDINRIADWTFENRIALNTSKTKTQNCM